MVPQIIAQVPLHTNTFNFVVVFNKWCFTSQNKCALIFILYWFPIADLFGSIWNFIFFEVARVDVNPLNEYLLCSTSFSVKPLGIHPCACK